jgi:hypothetical protein
VFNFAQPHPGNERRFPRSRSVVQGGVMAILEIDKHKEYVRYAEHCLKTATVITDQKSRAVLREMAAEWLKIADAVPPQSENVSCCKHCAVSL